MGEIAVAILWERTTFALLCGDGGGRSLGSRSLSILSLPPPSPHPAVLAWSAIVRSYDHVSKHATKVVGDNGAGLGLLAAEFGGLGLLRDRAKQRQDNEWQDATRDETRASRDKSRQDRTGPTAQQQEGRLCTPVCYLQQLPVSSRLFVSRFRPVWRSTEKKRSESWGAA